MFKRCLLRAMLLQVVLASSALAQNPKVAKYDTAWVPISSADLNRQIKTSTKDAAGLYQLWRRAQFQGQEQPFFSTLEQLRKEQPHNGTLLAMRCAMIEDSIMSKGHPQFQIAQEEWARVERRRAAVDAAKKMAPLLWLNYVTEAKLISWEQGSGVDPKVIKQQVSLCRVAVKLAPNLSFTNNSLGGYLSILSREEKYREVEVLRCYRKAQHLMPRNCGPSFGLIHYYRYNKPNVVERRKAEQAVLATIPPRLKLGTRQKQFLVKQGIVSPTG